MDERKGARKEMKLYNYMDPAMIMTVVVSLIILGVGVYAFFVTLNSIPTIDATTTAAVNNVSKTGNSVFNIVGVVLIIGAIMTIIGLVYSYMKPGGY